MARRTGGGRDSVAGPRLHVAAELGDAVSPIRERPTPLSPAMRGTLVAVGVLTVLVLPLCADHLGPQPAFLPVVTSSVLLLDVTSAFLLAVRFRDTGDRRVLASAGAYVWSALSVLGYFLAFPGLVAAHPPLGAWPSASPWLYLSWQVGFPVLLGLAWVPWPLGWMEEVPVEDRTRILAQGFGAVVLAGVVGVGIVAWAGRFFLPAVVEGTSTIHMSELAGPPGMVLALASAVVVTRGTRRRTGPERWVAVTVWVCTADLLFTFASLYRYSLGWYVGRMLAVVTASLVFLAMLGELVRLQRRLLIERGVLVVDAHADPLTGLANRSVLYESLERRLRYRSSDCLVLVALDYFREVNDTFGHQAGDAVLVETARRLMENTRAGDLVARLGGDEFALVLTGPFGDGELGGLMKRLSSALEHPHRTVLEGITERLTVGASLGFSLLSEHENVVDAMWTADNRLYRCKRAHSLQPVLQEIGTR